MVGNGKRSATFSATACENFAAVLCGHSLAEAMLVDSSAVGGLKSSFHLFVIKINTTMPRLGL